MADEGGLQQEFELEGEAERLVPRLKFLSTVARLWQIAARQAAAGEDRQADLNAWLASARASQEPLLALLDAIHQHPVPAPLGSYDSLVEYDRRRSVKDHLLRAAINTCLDTTMAVGTLEGALGQTGVAGSSIVPSDRSAWRAIIATSRLTAAASHNVDRVPNSSSSQNVARRQPQTAPSVTLSSASPEPLMLGLGTSMTLTSPSAWKVSAFI